MYDISLYCMLEEVGGFHTEDIKLSELLETIKEDYPEENITSIQIVKIR